MRDDPAQRRRSMRPGGRVAVVEQRVDDVGAPTYAPLMDINMLVMLPGRERTVDEYRSLLAEAGFGQTTVTPTDTPMVILVATAN